MLRGWQAPVLPPPDVHAFVEILRRETASIANPHFLFEMPAPAGFALLFAVLHAP
jgi:hypothetical protein